MNLFTPVNKLLRLLSWSWLRKLLLTIVIRNQKIFSFLMATFWHSQKKTNCVIFFKKFSFCFEIQSFSWTYWKVSSKYKFLDNAVHRKRLHPGELFLLSPISYKNFKRNQLRRQMFRNKVFYKTVFGVFFIQYIAREILIYFIFDWNRKRNF